MTIRTRHHPRASARTAASSARPPTAQRFVLATDRRAAGDDRARAAAGQPRHRARPLRIDVRREAPRRQGRPSRRRSPGSRPDDRFSVVVYDDVVDVVIASTPAVGRGASRRASSASRRRRARQHQPRRGLAARLRAGRRPPRRARRQPLPAPDRRPRQCRDHRPGRARQPRRRAARPRRLDLDVRCRQRLRRAAPPGHRRCRRRPLLLHRRRAADPRRDHLRGRRDARGRGPRRRPRDHGP